MIANMPNITPEEPKWRGMLPSLVQTLILAAVVWTASNVQSAHDAIIRLQTQVEVLQQSSNAAGTSLPAVQNEQAIESAKLDDLTRRIANLETIRGNIH